MGLGSLEYWEDRLRQGPSAETVGFIGLGTNYNEWMYRVRKQVFSRRIRALGIDLGRAAVLDIGSGSGFYVDAWKSLGIKSIVGCDITSVAVNKLRQRHPHHEFYQVDISGDLGELGRYRFDVISAFDVLFHITDDAGFQRAIRNVDSLLRPGGYFVFSENFLHGRTVRGPHQVSRSLTDIETAVNRADFQIVERVPMLFLMNSPVDSSNRARLALWEGLSRFVSAHEIFGLLAGTVLYPVELVCVTLLKESPTTEMMVCRKPDIHGPSISSPVAKCQHAG